MLLDLATTSTLLAIPMMLIGLCLVLYGKEILEVLSFPIGAVAGGVLAYMILRGFLAPYEIPFYIEFLVALVFVFIGGLMGPGTMVMAVALVISLSVVDVLNVILGEGYNTVSLIIGTILVMVIIYPVQKFLPFSSSAAGGVLIATALFMAIGDADTIIRTGVQVAIIVIATVAGGLFQTWLSRKIRANNEEITWVPTVS